MSNRRHRDPRRPHVPRASERMSTGEWAYHPTKGWRRVRSFTYHAIRGDYAIPQLVQLNRRVYAVKRQLIEASK